VRVKNCQPVTKPLGENHIVHGNLKLLLGVLRYIFAWKNGGISNPVSINERADLILGV
jgi:hypothetical protein